MAKGIGLVHTQSFFHSGSLARRGRHQQPQNALCPFCSPIAYYLHLYNPCKFSLNRQPIFVAIILQAFAFNVAMDSSTGINYLQNQIQHKKRGCDSENCFSV